MIVFERFVKMVNGFAIIQCDCEACKMQIRLTIRSIEIEGGRGKRGVAPNFGISDWETQSMST